MTEPTALALLRDAESYLSALHGSVARHDVLAANLGCAGCELRDRIAAALPTLAAEATVVAAPPSAANASAPLVAASPADRAAELAKHVTRAIYALKSPAPAGSEHYRSGWDDGLEAAIDAARDELLRRMADETPAETPDETDEQRADREETERDHAAGNHQYCGVTCEAEFPSDMLRNTILYRAIPGSKGALAELERRAAAGAQQDGAQP